MANAAQENQANYKKSFKYMARVLIVEQSNTKRLALSQAIAAEGFEITASANFWEAVQHLRADNGGAFEAVLIGWNSHEAELGALLQKQLNAPAMSLKPVIVLCDEDDPLLHAWLESRPNTHRVDFPDGQRVAGYLVELLEQQVASDAAEASERLDAQSAQTQAQLKLRLAELRVLLLEPNEPDRLRYAQLLDDAGYTVTAVTASEAVSRDVELEPFDIAVVAHGFLRSEFSALKRNHPRFLNTRCVVLMDTYHGRAVQESLEDGAVECMFKIESDALFLARMRALGHQIHLQKAAEEDRFRFEAILGSIGEGVYGVDPEGRITYFNPSGRRILGFRQREEYQGKHAQQLFHNPGRQRRGDAEESDPLAEAYTRGTELSQFETVFSQVNGHKVHVVCTVLPLEFNGVRQGSVVAFRDITDRKRLEIRLLRQAAHDPLTDLYNRRYFEKALSREVSLVKQGRVETGALLYLDFDQFKYLNDTAGHDAGDKLLVEASQRLKESVRTSDLVARMGGDEFAVILRDVRDEEAKRIADHLRARLQDVVYISDEVSFKLNCSIGIAMITPQLTERDVLANADVACGVAKRKGRNQSHLFSLSTDVDQIEMGEEMTWSTRLSDAIHSEGFTLLYQPVVPILQIDCDDLPAAQGVLWNANAHLSEHYEVLLRLNNGTREPIGPNAFLGVAERLNLIQQIDIWVVKAAIEQLRRLRRNGREVSLSVNLSGATLNAGEALREIEGMLARSELPANALVFEVTETSAINKIDVARNFIERMRNHGWRFALDDFGAGFSSFSQLRYLPVDIVKIEGLFVRGMIKDRINHSVVVAINEIAHSLGLETVAEYVEDAATLRELFRIHVDCAQGYYIARPLADIESRMEAITEELPLIQPIALA
ncbi:MAG: putative bifunctional diguanylate cyclase/phosphodiesterase [Thiotrichales bacterium]